MKGINIEEINSMNEEELNKTIDYLFQVKRDRETVKREKAVDELKKAWNMAVSLGVAIYDNDGYQITNFEDLDYNF